MRNKDNKKQWTLPLIKTITINNTLGGSAGGSEATQLTSHGS